MSIAVEPRTYFPTPTPRSFEGLKEERSRGLGGNDIAVLAGAARFGKTPLDVYLSKVHPSEPDDPGPDLRRGIAFEEHAIEVFEAVTGVEVLRPEGDLRTVSLDGAEWAQARVDGLLRGGRALLEVKLPRTQTYHEWLLEGLPMQYVMQAIWYLGITGLDACVYWVFNVEEYEGTAFEFYPDESVFEFLFNLGSKFWAEHIVPRVPPLPGPPEVELPEPLPSRQGQLERIPAGDRVEELALQYEKAGHHLKRMEGTKERIRDLLADALGEREGVLLEDGTKVYYRTGKPKNLGLDEKALRAVEPLDRIKVAIELRDVVRSDLRDRSGADDREVDRLTMEEVEKRIAKCGLDLDQFVKYGRPSRPIRLYPPKG
jgi:predicted phage-related endonuclease